MMRDAIFNFAKQFAWEPVIERPSKKRYSRVIVAGMGGSHLAADLFRAADPSVSLSVHRDYNLPSIAPHERASTLVIASSYSGNTEETIDAFKEARKKGIATAAISVGGKLGELSRRARVPYVRMPNTGIQPRSALGFSMKGLCALMGFHRINDELSRLAKTLKPIALEEKGKALAQSIKGAVPLVYASADNEAVAYNWKIKFNETGKIPAFYNVVPELNHNEMTGFDRTSKNVALSKRFHVLFLTDTKDHERIQKRMSILQKLYRQRGLVYTTIPLHGAQRWMRIFSSLVLADWVAYYIALVYGAEPEQVPMVEEFKKLMQE